MTIKLRIHPIESVDSQIERALRKRIRSGELSPLQRLPSTAALARQWRVTGASVQKAMERLAADGLIERSRKRGTFIKPSAEKAVIGVLVGPNLADETAQYCRAIVKFLRQEITGGKHRHWTYRLYDGLNEGGSSSADVTVSYGHFLTDLRNYAFKGIIHLLDHAKAPTRPALTLPSVRLGPAVRGLVADAVLDFNRFGRECVEFLARNGCKRIAYLRGIDSALDTVDDLAGIEIAARSFGLPAIEVHQLRRVMLSGQTMEEVAYDRALRLIEKWERQRCWPQACLVSDDIATRGVAVALLEKRIAVPRRLMLVTMANKGILHPYGLPVVRYEFCPREVARELLDLLWKRMVGKPLPSLPVKINTGRIVAPVKNFLRQPLGNKSAR